MGLLVYSALALGLGGWFNPPIRSGLATIGLRLTLGYAALIILAYVLGVVVDLPIQWTFATLATLAAAGLLVCLASSGWRVAWLKIAIHPGILLLLLGGAAVLVNGGVGYLPVGNDEFTHWLGSPLRLHTYGNWTDASPAFHHPGYTPGWPLVLTLAWQPFGEADFGFSSAAPFVLYVATAALVFDIAVYLFRQRLGLNPRTSTLAAWSFVLLFAAAEGLGPLWSRTLLIEPPQIYGYVAFLLLVYTAQIAPKDSRFLEFASGVVLASCFLIRTTALLFLPAVLFLCVLRAASFARLRTDGLRGPLVSFALISVPTLLAAGSWEMIADAKGCYYSPFETLSLEALAHAGKHDWWGFGVRYLGAVWNYVATYKTPLTMAAAVGVLMAVAQGKGRTPLLLAIMATAFLASLYWLRLTCTGDVFVENLNSIPRFTRILVQSLHGLGLVLLLDGTLTLLGRHLGAELVDRLASKRWVGVWLASVILLLGAWQANQISRSVVDVTTRQLQSVDPRLSEIRRAARAIEAAKARSLGDQPLLLIIAQGSDKAVIDVARFLALGRRHGETSHLYRVINEASWSPSPSNVWQKRADAEHVRRRLSEADIVWPIILDSWMRGILVDLIEDQSCFDALPNKALVRSRGEPLRFSCLDKGPVL